MSKKAKVCELCEEQPATLLCAECCRCYCDRCDECKEFVQWSTNSHQHRIPFCFEQGEYISWDCDLKRMSEEDKEIKYVVKIKKAEKKYLNNLE